MKKLLTIALLFAGLTASAQGVWITGVTEPDNLKGIPERTYYQYDVEGVGSFILFDWDDWTFHIFTDKGTFDVRPENSGSLPILMGLYTPDGQLIEKLETTIAANYTTRTSAWVNKEWWYLHNPKKKIKRMLQALKTGEGYVRIVCKRQGVINQDFDLTITKYDITEENSTAYKEYTQILNRSTQFYDESDYSSPDDVVVAARENNLKCTILKKGERFKVLSIAGQQLMLAKVQLPNGKVGWMYPLHVPNKKDFLPYLPFREKFLPNIDTKSVVPGMTREEVFIITGNYLSPEDKSYKAFGDYIWYNFTNANYLFYNNSLYFATNCNGAFYYRCFVDYKLTNVSRDESVMDNSISSSSNYKDELLSVSWMIDRNKANFTIKNNASGSIKILWDDMAFVGLNGESHRVIHKGIKYSEKEKEQAPSIVARNAEWHDLIIPADKIYYQKSWEKWSAYPFVDDFLYSPEDESTKHPNGKKIQVLLPVIINEKKYEYQFVFEIENIRFSLMNFDYYKSSRVADELR